MRTKGEEIRLTTEQENQVRDELLGTCSGDELEPILGEEFEGLYIHDLHEQTIANLNLPTPKGGGRFSEGLLSAYPDRRLRQVESKLQHSGKLGAFMLRHYYAWLRDEQQRLTTATTLLLEGEARA